MLINLRNALMTGKRVPTAKDYVQDGLVAMWDGIENAGWGAYNPNATVWKNLTGDTAWDMAVHAAWQNDGLYFDGTWCGKAPKTTMTDVTIECVSDNVMTSFLLSVGWSQQYSQKRYSLLLNANTSLLRGYVGSQAFDGTFGTYRHTALTVNNGSSALWGNGTMKGSCLTGDAITGETATHFRLGGYGTRYDDDASEMFFKGHIYRCAIYSRALTASEIAANNAIDKARFGLP